MSLNLPEVREVVDLLAQDLQGAIVRRVQEDDDAQSDLILELRTPGENHWIRISVEHQLTRLHRIAGRPGAPREPSGFTMLLRSRLIGARLRDIGLVGDDRVVRLRFEHHDGTVLSLVAELIGKDANIFLLDDADEIVGILSARTASHRGLVTHGLWRPPKPAPEQPQQARSDWPDQGEDIEGWLEERYEALAKEQEFAALQRTLRQRLKQELKRARRTHRAVEGDLDKADGSAELKHEADLLQTVRHQLARGAHEAHVADWLDEGRERVVALDPARSLQDQIAERYKTYKRLQNAADRILARLEELEERVARLEQAWDTFQSSTSVTALKELQAHLEREGLLRRQRPQRGGRGTEERAKPYKTAQSADGFTLLVGRSARDNDTLTIQVARGRDLWLHARDVAGSHVIVRRNKKEDVPYSTLLEAANLAACYSKSRNDTNVEVGYTERKHVSKPKGLGPGQVHVAGMKTLLVSPDPEQARMSFERMARSNADAADA